MFSTKPTYFSTTKKMISVFGTIFNELYIATPSGNKRVKYQKVPIEYGPRDKWLERITKRENLEDSRIAIKFPRMSYKFENFEVDPNKRINRLHRLRHTEDTSTSNTQLVDVPYTADVTLSIGAKTETEVFQIVEQILPIFNPDVNLIVNGLNGPTDKKTMVSIILTGVNPSDEYEGSFEDRRIILWELTFRVKYSYAKATSDAKIIREITIDILDDNRNMGDRISITVDADDTKDSYTVTQSIDEIDAS